MLAIVALFLPRGGEPGKRPGMPWFVVGFFAMAGINSAGFIPPVAGSTMETTAAALLAAAVTATAIRSPLSQLLEAGPRPLIIVVVATLTALVGAIAATFFLIG